MSALMPPSHARRGFLRRLGILAGGALLPFRPSVARAAPQALDPYIGEIMIVAFDFTPRGWGACNGQHLLISQNQALFGVLGTTYGGNGVTTFALPDLRGRLALHHGEGPGLSPRSRGQLGGGLAHTLGPMEMPAHHHVARASAVAGTSPDPSGSVVLARSAAGVPQWGPTADAIMGDAVTATGASQPHDNTQPYLAMHFVIALVGIYPTP